MKNIVYGVAASAIIASFWGACTVTTDDGGGAGNAGTGGSTGTGGSGTGTGGAAGAATGGSAGASGGGPTDASADSGPISDCQVCGNQMCNRQTLACTGDDTGCGRIFRDLYDCISTSADIDGCVTMFITEVNTSDGGASRLNDLGGCLNDNCTVACTTPTD